MLTVLLLILQVGIYLLNRFAVKKKAYKRLLSVAVFALLAVWAVHHGGREFLTFNVWLLLVSVIGSYALYFLSLVIVGTKLTKENLLPFRCIRFGGKLKTALRKESLRNLYSSSYEELLYRWFLQNALYELTRSAVLSISVTVVVFTAIHYRRNVAIVQMMDIFTFSLAITVWFWFAENPLYGILIHILRNQFVIFQKYVAYQSENERRAKYLKMLKERRIREKQ